MKGNFYCHRQKRFFAYLFRACLIIAVFSISLLVKIISVQHEGAEPIVERYIPSNINDQHDEIHSGPRRKLLSDGSFSFVYVYANGTVIRDRNKIISVLLNSTNITEELKELQCTPPAYHEFPPDAFTNQQRKQGGLVVHLLVVSYMFVALAVVCDIYFVASLQKISEKLNLSDDVAGATFMAAGSSAPEFCTSIIGVFVAKGDVGVGTIVGSAVFNILFVIGICGVLVQQLLIPVLPDSYEVVPLSRNDYLLYAMPVVLTWWPLGRDSVFYCLSVVMLISAIANAKVYWYEALFLIILYVLYIIIMKFNSQLQTMALNKFKSFGEAPEDHSAILPTGAKVKYYTNYEQFPQGNKDQQKPEGNHVVKQEPVIHVDSYIHDYRTKLSFEDACFQFMKGRRFKPLTRFKAAAYIILLERRKLLKDSVLKNQYVYIDGLTSEPKNFYDDLSEVSADVGDSWKRLPSMENDGLLYVIKWVFLTPINAVLYFTIPDCSKERWERWFMLTFVMSIVWLASFSYIMVWMVALIGYTLGIPDSIMGITFLAAGTSVPDAMASVMVARQGQGDMAVSNTLGSNVFDICMGLAVPWFIQTAMVASGSYVHINSNGIIFSVLLLFLTVIITLVSVHLLGWVLNKKLGVVCLSSYAVFLTFSIMIEFNVFGYVNAPMCPE